MRKRIAVLTAQIDESTQHRFLTAFMKEAYAHDYDLYIFTMYQKFQETALRDIGDSNIFSLINFNMFDAVLVMIDTILTTGLAEPLQKRIKNEFAGPVLLIDRQSTYFESVMMDHYTPVKKLVDHLIEVHGYKEIAFLGGKAGHPHSVQRKNAYYDSMKAHGLTIREDWVFDGNYWYDSAEEFADRLLLHREHLPRAIACANDCMAIGVAARLTENGVKIPEEVALIGYDSLPEGKDSPEPLTSAEIPADECGTYCLLWLDSKINHKPLPEFQTKAPLFIGSSCGCNNKTEMEPAKRRAVWRTRQSSRGVFSDFNHILEDLLSHSDMDSFLKTIEQYTYQITPLYTFDLCLIDGFLDPECCVGQKALRRGYTDKLYHVLGVGEGQEDGPTIRFDRVFPKEQLRPNADKELPYPTTYIFNPIYFEDRCFGYSILNHKDNLRLYDRGYRIWMRNIMQGMEAFYRQQFMQLLIKEIQSKQIRDDLTGLYNYEGFIKQTLRLMRSDRNKEKKIHILAVDMKGLRSINEMYGRQAGDRCLKSLSRFLSEILREDEICARMCNDEFLVSLLDKGDNGRCEEIAKTLHNKLRVNPVMVETEIDLDFSYASVFDTTSKTDALEGLINHAINVKNHNKRKLSKDQMAPQNVENEVRQNQIVERVLNQNQLTYFYQPIVSTKDGSIYGYEALMRHVDGAVTPLQILQSANYLRRLNDVETATLLNVTKDVEDHMELFAGKKVFLNSIPGTSVSDVNDAIITIRIHRRVGMFVIEFTEENEMEEEALVRLKEKFQRIGAFIAIDDFGVGYSNVSNLLRYMPQYVKVDRLLISNIQNNPQKRHFVRSILEFAHDNDILVLAEGVEEQAELKECIALGFDLVQGYYTGRPQRNAVSEILPEISDEIIRYRLQNEEWQIKFQI